jgi:hypothetical protein
LALGSETVLMEIVSSKFYLSEVDYVEAIFGEAAKVCTGLGMTNLMS